MTRWLRLAAAVLLCTGAALLGTPAASAAETGLLRLAHLSPDTPNVDVYVDSVSDPTATLTIPGVGYGTISDYQQVPPGTYTISMRSAGADPSSPPVLSTTVDVQPGTAHTVAGLGKFASLDLEVLDDDLTLPPAGQARVRVVDAAAAAPTLDVSAGGTPVAADLAFATAGQYVDVPGGTSTLTVDPGSGPTDVPVQLAAGSVYTVLVLDQADGGLRVQTAQDAASPGVVPAGPVEAGGGGTAGGGLPVTALGAGGVAVLAGAGLLLTGRVRPGRRSAASRRAARS
jgi:hypothetical protein